MPGGALPSIFSSLGLSVPKSPVRFLHDFFPPHFGLPTLLKLCVKLNHPPAILHRKKSGAEVHQPSCILDVETLNRGIVWN
jgi:hypothetical protein